MSIKKLFLMAAFVMSSSFASASLITFDGATGTIIGSFSESGFTFTLNGGSTPHFGDGGQPNGILDWHNGGANASNAIVTMTENGGNLFNLSGFDIYGSAMNIGGVIYGIGSHAVNLTGLSSITFDLTSFQGGIDNLNVNVSEPSPFALLALGLAGLGLARRKARR
ncbi:PEP-CTERM sorting domain-containing protein [Dasania sp. GY-MA-18]|uniref:PEP-CTERM sorting domain-containing protein n=1 Tax=Dasania phycosphaerae TaxID=2950436 RepID=A0A9J6RRW6_9GAMM|nr:MULTISPECIES: PEP-CTERM sorting domain-containing protein [Dasania]MCR8924250.1 PEP-CTERM sorting domain-containing protein [Dasania sp. GY-MA-18]MCZ0866903.1 PEP-CTERM sorting domain-containing protein [Dasania phycosphaerae]MCZ0870407.1 PEP-CTERM sorting domain-containing protein [Dasania phycosphaerae]